MSFELRGPFFKILKDVSRPFLKTSGKQIDGPCIKNLSGCLFQKQSSK